MSRLKNVITATPAIAVRGEGFPSVFSVFYKIKNTFSIFHIFIFENFFHFFNF